MVKEPTPATFQLTQTSASTDAGPTTRVLSGSQQHGGMEGKQAFLPLIQRLLLESICRRSLTFCTWQASCGSVASFFSTCSIAYITVV